MTPIFNREWRLSCRALPCKVSALDDFIKAHYLRKRPAIVVLCMLALRGCDRLGGIVYSAPPRETEKRYGGKTWELARLYLLDSVPCHAETWLIGQSVRYIRRARPEVQFLVSYADPSVGHTGLIYRAANWQPDGRTDDERKSPRCDLVDKRTGKLYGRWGNIPADAEVVRVPRASKFRFVLALK